MRRLLGGLDGIPACFRPVLHHTPTEAECLIRARCRFKLDLYAGNFQQLRQVVRVASLDEAFLGKVELADLLGDARLESTFDSVASEVIRAVVRVLFTPP